MIHKSFNVLPLCQGHYMPAVIIPQVIERRLTLCAFHHFAVWGKCHHQTSGVSLSVMTVSGTGRASVLGGSLLGIKVWQTTIHIWVAPCSIFSLWRLFSPRCKCPRSRVWKREIQIHAKPKSQPLAPRVKYWNLQRFACRLELFPWKNSRLQYTYHIMLCHVSFIIIPNISK